jgi:hypothetical protein
MGIKVIGLIGLLVVAIASVIFLLLDILEKDVNLDDLELFNSESGEFGEKNLPREIGGENYLPENSVETGSVSSGGSGSDGSSGSGSGGDLKGCDIQEISYLMGGFITQETCNLFQNGVCVEKTLVCSTVVQNLDDNTLGNFIIDVIAVEQGFANQDPIFSSIVTHSIDSGEQEIFQNIFKIQSQGENGNANKDLTCSYEPIEVPLEEVC